MRILRFIVDNQIIRQDPKCDFSNLVPGSEGSIRAEFIFSKEWHGSQKVAAFYSNLGRELGAEILNDGRTCLIPASALSHSIFKVEILGSKTTIKLRTNKVEVHQEGGKP